MSRLASAAAVSLATALAAACSAPATVTRPPVVAAAGPQSHTAWVGRAGQTESLTCPEGEVVVGAQVGTEYSGVSSMRLLCRPVVAASKAPALPAPRELDAEAVARCERGDATVCETLGDQLLEGRPYDRDAARAAHLYRLAIKAERARAANALVRQVEPGPAVPPREYDYSWIVKTGEYEYRLDPKALDEALSDLTIIVSQARVIPNYRGGKYQGFKLVGVRPGSIYRAMGIRSGDIIHDVDGMQIDSPNKAIELFSSLKESERVVVGIERRGQRKEFLYVISAP